MMDLNWTRRSFVVAFAAAGTAALAAAGSSAAPNAATPDPRRSADGLAKAKASTAAGPTPWWFAGILYAQQGEQKPRPFVRCEGCEQYRTVRQTDGTILLQGATLTFFRDVRTGAFLETFENPLTGQRVEVIANVLKARSGGGQLIAADGSGARMVSKPESTGQLNYKPPAAGDEAEHPVGELTWHVVGENVVLTTTSAIATPAQPWLETSTITTTRAAFFDPAVRAAPAVGAVTYLSPWLRWMKMDDVPGHLVWHASSVKLSSLDLLPDEYRARARALNLLQTFE